MRVKDCEVKKVLCNFFCLKQRSLLEMKSIISNIVKKSQKPTLWATN